MCDAKGHVDLDAFGERERNNYFYARVLIGHDFFAPTVRHCSQQCPACARSIQKSGASGKAEFATIARQ